MFILVMVEPYFSSFLIIIVGYSSTKELLFIRVLVDLSGTGVTFTTLERLLM